MKRLLIYTVFLKTLLLGLSGISLASEDNYIAQCQCPNILLETFKYLKGDDQIEDDHVEVEDVAAENNIDDAWMEINGKYYSVKSVKWILLTSINDDNSEKYDISAIVEKVSNRFLKDDIRAKIRAIDKNDLMIFINQEIPEFSFDVEKTYEVAQILIFTGLLDEDELEKVSSFDNQTKC